MYLCAVNNILAEIMPRQERLQSVTGIYHVMLRGINKHITACLSPCALFPSSVSDSFVTTSVAMCNPTSPAARLFPSLLGFLRGLQHSNLL